MKFSFSGINYNLVPLIGSSFEPVVLNFILFFPYGVLLPLVFCKRAWNWKKILLVGGLTSLLIEGLQMFGGRYAEIDDLIINSMGTLVGYLVYLCMDQWRNNRKQSMILFVSVVSATALCFCGIYAVGNHETYLPDGLDAVEDTIQEAAVSYNSEKHVIDISSEIYQRFATQLSNCGGHVFEIKELEKEKMADDTDCFIEIVFTQPQEIVFENQPDFSIENADRIKYNSTENILYWGNLNYQYKIDFTKMDDALQANREEILDDYKRLDTLIKNDF